MWPPNIVGVYFLASALGGRYAVNGHSQPDIQDKGLEETQP